MSGVSRRRATCDVEPGPGRRRPVSLSRSFVCVYVCVTGFFSLFRHSRTFSLPNLKRQLLGTTKNGKHARLPCRTSSGTCCWAVTARIGKDRLAEVTQEPRVQWSVGMDRSWAGCAVGLYVRGCKGGYAGSASDPAVARVRVAVGVSGSCAARSNRNREESRARRPFVCSLRYAAARGMPKIAANVQCVARCNVHDVGGVCDVGASRARARALWIGVGARLASKRTFLRQKNVEKKHVALHVARRHDVGVCAQHGGSAAERVLPCAEGRGFILDDGPVDHLREPRGAAGGEPTRGACRSDAPSIGQLTCRFFSRTQSSYR